MNNKRVCIWFRLLYALIAGVGLMIASTYTAQLRYINLGLCPQAVLNGPSVLMLDTLRVETFCIPLPNPEPIPSIPPQGDTEL